jgi:hypothetical protein
VEGQRYFYSIRLVRFFYPPPSSSDFERFFSFREQQKLSFNVIRML